DSLARRSTYLILSRCLRLTRSGRWTTYWQRPISVTYRRVFTRRFTKIPSRTFGCGSTAIKGCVIKLRDLHARGNDGINPTTVGRAYSEKESMTTIKAIRLASLITAINVLVASGFSIAAIIRPQYLVPAESVQTEASLLLAMYAAAPRIPLALLVLWAIYKQATPALLILGALAGAM